MDLGKPAWPINLYPIAIVQDRYGGCYSGGAWLAVSEANAPYDSISRIVFVLNEGPHGEDLEAQDFWIDPPDWIAVGDTPDAAHAALLAQTDPNAAVKPPRPRGRRS